MFVFNEMNELFRAYDFFHRHRLFAFNARKIVEVFPDVVVAAFVEVNSDFSSDNQIVEIPSRDFQLLQFHGTLHHGLVGEGEALGLQRAQQAVGVFGCAMQRAEFHHGLVVEAGLLAVEELVGEAGKEFLPLININRCIDVVEAGQHAMHIPVNHGMGQVEGNGSNGRSRIVADAFQFSELLEIGGERSVVLEIECSKTKVGMIGLFIYSGLAVGSLVFSIINKYLSYRLLIITFTIVYVFFLFLTTIIANFYFRLFCLFCLGICNCLANMSTMTLVSESVSSKKRSLFTGVINSGYSFCPIVYTPLYVILGQWRYIFWIENIVAIACAIVYFLFWKIHLV